MRLYHSRSDGADKVFWCHEHFPVVGMYLQCSKVAKYLVWRWVGSDTILILNHLKYQQHRNINYTEISTTLKYQQHWNINYSFLKLLGRWIINIWDADNGRLTDTQSHQQSYWNPNPLMRVIWIPKICWTISELKG